MSTLATWIPGGADAARAWPDPRFGGPSQVVLVARHGLHGLSWGLHAARQWAAHDVPDIELLGAVIVAGAPSGRPAPVLEEHLSRLRGVLGSVWLIPWLDELRFVEPGQISGRCLPRAALQLRKQLVTLTTAHPQQQETSC